jgi:hypothetical protein
MIIIWGTRFYGKVDETPGLFHVATKFGHLWYIPLVPSGSFLVLSQEKNSIRGVKIPLSGKSVLAAWLRGGSVAAAVAFAIVAMVVAGDPRAKGGEGAVYGAMSAVCVVMAVLAWRLNWFRRGSHARAMELARIAKMPEEVSVLIDVRYGRITEAEGQELLRELREARAAGTPAAPPTAPAGV